MSPKEVSLDANTEPALHEICVNDCDLAYVERHLELKGHGPTLLLVHATGFHARVWDQIIARLPACHSIALDQRGHGRSEKKSIDDWRILGHDQAALVEALDLDDIVGVGHSMGAHAMIDAAAIHPDRFRRLVLVDPTVAEPAAYAEAVSVDLGGRMHPAAKRRNRFESVDAMMERLADRSSFHLFEPKIFRDYCEYGLVPAEDGDGFVLACPPEIEAAVYMTSRSNSGVYDSVRSLDIPVLILRARAPSPDVTGAMVFSTSPTWPGLVDEFKQGRELHYPDRTHFLPMEIPDEVATLIAEELASTSH